MRSSKQLMSRVFGMDVAGFPPTWSSGAGGCAEADPCDSELLDLMAAEEDQACFLRNHATLNSVCPPSSSSSDGGKENSASQVKRDVPKKGSVEVDAATPPVQLAHHHLPSFLIGGSLFALGPKRFGTGPAGAHVASNSSGQRAERWGNAFSASTSFLCPFTRQFFSVCSPHSAHLHAAGFAVRVAPHRGRSVALHNSRKLIALARRLQYDGGEDPSEIAEGLLPSGRRPDTLERRQGSRLPSKLAWQAALLESWGWCLELRRTLGAFLCAVPLESTTADVEAALHEIMHAKTSLFASRVIKPVGLLVDGEYEGPSTGKRETAAGALKAAYSTPAAMRCPWQVRTRVLQSPHDCALFRVPQGIVAAWQVPAMPSAPTHLSPLVTQLDSWLTSHRERPPIPLLGLPFTARAAFFDLPYPAPSVTSCTSTVSPDALMDAACAAALDQLRLQMSNAAAHGDIPMSSMLFYCPLAHAVDYCSTEDLRVFRVEWQRCGCHGDTPYADDGAWPPGRASLAVQGATLAESLPVLSLGAETLAADAAKATPIEGTPPLRVVVFSNAHFLSKLATRRLVDQWTRNGAAYRQLYERKRAHVRRSHWQALMGGHVPLPPETATLLPHMRSLSVPFGDVQSVFIGFTADCISRGVGSGGARDSPVVSSAVVQPPMMPTTRSRVELLVDPRAHTDLLHVEEPLSAALLRASALYRTCLSGTERRALIETVTHSVLNGTPKGTLFVKRCSKRTVSGRLVSDRAEVLLHSEQGHLQLHEACETVLSLVSTVDACLGSHLATPRTAGDCRAAEDEVTAALVMYPSLSTLRIRHTLLSAYRVRITTSNASHSCSDVPTRPCGNSEDGWSAEKQPRNNDRSGDAANETASVTPSRIRFMERRMYAAKYGEGVSEHHLQLARAGAMATTSSPLFAPQLLLPWQGYTACAEPPVLVGWWTSTLTFCAPALADVVPLRAFLLEALAIRYSRSPETSSESSRRAECEDRECAEDSVDFAYRLHDVDIFHMDFAGLQARSPRRLFRVFGVRAALRPRQHGNSKRPAENGGAVTTSKGSSTSGTHAHRLAQALAQLECHLQKCMKELTRDAFWCSLWAFHFRRRHKGNMHPGRRQAIPPHDAADASGAAGSLPFPRVSSEVHEQLEPNCPDFPALDELSTLWTPLLVERRLFTLAAAQHPMLSLALGTVVVLLRSVRVPMDVAGSPRDTGDSGSGGRYVRIPRGSICKVVGFVAVRQILAHLAQSGRRSSHSVSASARSTGAPVTSLSSISNTIRRQIEDWTPREREMVSWYARQQRDASTLPVLRCYFVGGSSDCADVQPFVLAPRSAIVGGYRSLHYYGLPLLHLPALELAGVHISTLTPERCPLRCTAAAGDASTTSLIECHPGKALAGPLMSTSPCVSFNYVLPHLFHPHHADPTTQRATVCLTWRERRQGERLLFERLCKITHNAHTTAASEEAVLEQRSPVSFVEDILFSSSGDTNGQQAMDITFAALHSLDNSNGAGDGLPAFERCAVTNMDE